MTTTIAMCDRRLDDLGLSARPINALAKRGVQTVGDLLCLSKQEVRCTRGMGEGSFDELVEAIEGMGVELSIHPPKGRHPRFASVGEIGLDSVIVRMLGVAGAQCLGELIDTDDWKGLLSAAHVEAVTKAVDAFCEAAGSQGAEEEPPEEPETPQEDQGPPGDDEGDGVVLTPSPKPTYRPRPAQKPQKRNREDKPKGDAPKTEAPPEAPKAPPKAATPPAKPKTTAKPKTAAKPKPPASRNSGEILKDRHELFQKLEDLYLDESLDMDTFDARNEALLEALDASDIELEEKVWRYCKAKAAIDVEAGRAKGAYEAAQAEADRLKKRWKTREGKIKWLKTSLMWFLEQAGVDKVKTPDWDVSIQLADWSVAEADLKMLPACCVRVTKAPDKKGIVDLFKRLGHKIPGALLVKTKGIRIR